MKYTENYNLPLYEPNDLANLMDGYNESMNTLDDVMKTNIDIVDDYTGTVVQNKADIAVNTKILNAEIARATERESEIEKESADSISTLQKSFKRVLVCGDSFTAGSYTDWLKYIHKYNVSNYAVNGAGLTRPNSVFTQLDKAHSEFPDSDSVYMLILYCGVNDFNHRAETSENIGTKLVEWITNAVSYFPNTKIVVCYGNVGRQYVYAGTYNFYGFYSWLNSIYETVYSSNIANMVTIINPSSWLKFNSGKLHATDGNFQSDDLHPTTKGAAIIASYMQSIMDGCYAFRPCTKTEAFDGPVDLLNSSGVVVGSVSDIKISITVTEDILPTVCVYIKNYEYTVETSTILNKYIFIDSEQLGDIPLLLEESIAEFTFTEQRFPMTSNGFIKDALVYRYNHASVYTNKDSFCFRITDKIEQAPETNLIVLQM